ncbi:MAG: hypothetical protein QOE65_664 [Solirubrobacteraceae bacterium]|nr:hypothetical protein [Solirubrobacteraceae bacterium]
MLSALAQARTNGYGRIALGLGMVVAPEAATRPWMGEDAARPGVQALTRMVGARDVVLGFLTAHTAARPGVGPRTLATVALVDAVDAAAVSGARDRLPGTAAGVIALAAGSAVQLVAAAIALR